MREAWTTPAWTYMSLVAHPYWQVLEPAYDHRMEAREAWKKSQAGPLAIEQLLELLERQERPLHPLHA